MALNGSDLFMISRAGVHYSLTGSSLLAYVLGNLGSTEYKVANIAARNALNSSMSIGDTVMVDDATADGTVTAGWALYQWIASNSWRKIAEQESMDIVMGGVTNLSVTVGPTNQIVVSDTGTDAILLAADGTNAGLMLPAQFTKLSNITIGGAINLDTVKTKTDFITVTVATNLDTIRTASHAAVTTAGNATNNPIVLAGQELSFNIAGLTSAP